MDQVETQSRHHRSGRDGNEPCEDDVLGHTPSNGRHPLSGADAHNAGRDDVCGGNGAAQQGCSQDDPCGGRLCAESVDRPQAVDLRAQGFDDSPTAAGCPEGNG